MDNKKCAIVTGAASGFGKALTLMLVKNGIKVIVADISVEEGQAFEKEVNKNGKNIVFVKCDVTKESDLINLFEQATQHFGGAQIMVNNAGIGPAEHFNTTTKAIDSVVAVNLTAVLKGTSLAIQHFNQQKAKSNQKDLDFSIINVSSLSAIIPLTISPVYSVTKMGVLYLTKNFDYLSKKGIRVNAVAPAFSPTKIMDNGKNSSVFKKIVESQGGLIPIEKVANQMLKLIQDKSVFGEVVVIGPNKEYLVPKNPLKGINKL
ncbi:NAD(P)-binding protein [Neoconidiobolus thromboides FSU 785]|nr:NAD(P)-binding protein [Neoconidiobolus thromboides FSU 785]